MDHPHHLLAKHCATLMINLIKSLSLRPFWDSSRAFKSKVTTQLQKEVLLEASRVEVSGEEREERREGGEGGGRRRIKSLSLRPFWDSSRAFKSKVTTQIQKEVLLRLPELRYEEGERRMEGEGGTGRKMIESLSLRPFWNSSRAFRSKVTPQTQKEVSLEASRIEV
jgi:hypothetical protein